MVVLERDALVKRLGMVWTLGRRSRPETREYVRQMSERSDRWHGTCARGGVISDTCRPVALVVDDEASVCTTLKILLKLRGFETVTASSGAEALAAFEKGGEFQFVLTDFSMPEMTGLELAIAIKAKAPRQPVFLFTAYAERFRSQPPLPAIDKILEKPISMVKLDEAIALAAG